MKKIKPGNLHKQIDAATYNNMVDAAEAYNRSSTLGGNGDWLASIATPCVIKVKNNTGGDLRLGEICDIDLGSALLSSVSRRYQWFNSENAAPTETNPWGIALKRIPSGDHGPVQIAGACPALINVQATTDLWAYVNSGDDVLKGDRFWGDVRLLATPGSTGEQLMFVSIEKSDQAWLGKTTGISANASGDVSIWAGTPGSESDTTYDITGCYNRGPAIDSGDWVMVQRLFRKKYVGKYQC